MATWDAPAPDLVIVDRGQPRERVRITVLQGESGFRNAIAQHRMPIRGLEPGDWYIDIARLEGKLPDLVAVARRGTGSRTPELHVSDGESRFQRFLSHQRIDLAPFDSNVLLAPITAVARPGLAVVDTGASPRRVQLIPAGPEPSGGGADSG